MSKLLFSVVLIAIAATFAYAQDVPFATPPRINSSPTGDTVAGLAEIMGKIQLRHMKLWSAIRAKNWPLVTYEVGQSLDSFGNAVIFYRNIPVELISAAAMPLADIRDAARSKDAIKAERAYIKFTSACNSCHRAGGVPFIRITVPSASPFSNQKF